MAGCATLEALVREARGRIGILAAAGIDPSNVGAILATGVDEIHASCQVPRPDGEARLIELGFAEVGQGRTTADAVRALASAIEQWSGEVR
jgi:copper homeostasis protein